MARAPFAAVDAGSARESAAGHNRRAAVDDDAIGHGPGALSAEVGAGSAKESASKRGLRAVIDRDAIGNGFWGATGVDPEPGEAGFTLVEMVVSLALAALIAVLLVQTLRITAGASAVVARIAAAEEVQSVRDHLRRTLGSLAKRRIDGRRPAFRGGPDGLVAIVAPDAAVERPAEMQVALGGAAGAGPGLDLVESRTVFDALPGVEAASHREVLLPGIAGWQVRYFGAPAEHAPPAWLAGWTRNDVPPRLVEIRVAFGPGDRRRWEPLLVSLGDRP